MNFTVKIENGEILFPVQSEVELLALVTLGSSREVYFDEIPINDTLHIKFNKEKNTWILQENQI